MKRGKKATIRMGEVEIPAEIVSEPGVLPQNFRTPPFYVEVDPARALIHAFSGMSVEKLSYVVGWAAKQLHVAAHSDLKFHKAFVYKRGRYYVFEFHRHHDGEIVATLTALSDHRVRVTYHDGKEPETLYL